MGENGLQVFDVVPLQESKDLSLTSTNLWMGRMCTAVNLGTTLQPIMLA